MTTVAAGREAVRRSRPSPVLCVPYAGAGAGVYRPWQQAPGPLLRPVPLQLPGREEEFTRPFHDSIDVAVADLVRRVRAEAGQEPFVLFGHSLGAVLAYETTRHLLASGGPAPAQLVVSGSASPRRRRPPDPVGDEPDERTVARLRELTGASLETLEDPELRELLLPALLADLAMLVDYRPPRDPAPLPLPVTAIRGSSDATVLVEDCQDWEAYTSAAFRCAELPGGHMYLDHSWPALRQILEALV